MKIQHCNPFVCNFNQPKEQLIEEQNRRNEVLPIIFVPEEEGRILRLLARAAPQVELKKTSQVYPLKRELQPKQERVNPFPPRRKH
jgi:hypothetical protein